MWFDSTEVHYNDDRETTLPKPALPEFDGSGVETQQPAQSRVLVPAAVQFTISGTPESDQLQTLIPNGIPNQYATNLSNHRGRRIAGILISSVVQNGNHDRGETTVGAEEIPATAFEPPA